MANKVTAGTSGTNQKFNDPPEEFRKIMDFDRYVTNPSIPVDLPESFEWDPMKATLAFFADIRSKKIKPEDALTTLNMALLPFGKISREVISIIDVNNLLTNVESGKGLTRRYVFEEVNHFAIRYLTIATGLYLEKNVAEELASFLLLHFTIIVISDTDMLVMYDLVLGTYVEATDNLRRIIFTLFKTLAPNSWSMATEAKTLAILKRSARRLESTSFDRGYFSFRNHDLNLNTLLLEEHHPNHLTLIHSDIEPIKAKTPVFDNFASTTFNDDPDEITFLLEYFGSHVLSVQTGVINFFFSSGASGKSTVGFILKSLFGGATNFASVRASQLSGDFGLQPLIGKLGTFSDENDANEDISAVALKSIATGSVITVNRKHEKAINTVLRAKQTYVWNQIPRSEQTVGFSRRLLFLTFPNTFTPAQQDIHLNEKLAAEFDGILFLAIEALKGYVTRDNKFTESERMIADREAFFLIGRPVAAFITDTVTSKPGNKVTRAEVMSIYQEWLEQTGTAPQGTTIPRKFWAEFRNELSNELHLTLVEAKGSNGRYVADLSFNLPTTTHKESDND